MRIRYRRRAFRCGCIYKPPEGHVWFYNFASSLQRLYVAAPSSLGVTHLLRRPAVGNDVTPLSMRVTRPSLCLVLLSRSSVSADISPTQRRVLRRYWGKQSVCGCTHAKTGQPFSQPRADVFIIARLSAGIPPAAGLVQAWQACPPPPTTSQSQDSASQCSRERCQIVAETI